MSALSDVSISHDTISDNALKSLIAILLWGWIDSHGEDTFTLHVWLFKKTFKIKDLRDVFALLLGPPPVA